MPAVEAEQSAGQLPPSAVLVSAAHNALGELLLDRTLAGSGDITQAVPAYWQCVPL